MQSHFTHAKSIWDNHLNAYLNGRRQSITPPKQPIYSLLGGVIYIFLEFIYLNVNLSFV
ncbi:hypothetical protein IX296_003062 [Bacteroides pyogenes]|nr:hypothetical protein [Bacteroides pyogenes]MBR8737739.1 hypothetical protein [Bacteroides pyogenes]MBR8753488.1 hypothetical protein [Bacteroides pyogenes]MBR8794838.1 hypothetical protein [Bacteroides pyogenes]MBR8810740.1 hypothetical protein [Bacteroides pyogenes]